MRNYVSFDDFDPNKIGKDQPVWAVYNNYRFKTYCLRSAALQGFMRGSQAKLYKFNAGHWDLIIVRDESHRPVLCDYCGGSTMGYTQEYSYSQRAYVASPTPVNLGGYVWERDHKQKIVDPPVLNFLCEACRR